MRAHLIGFVAVLATLGLAPLAQASSDARPAKSHNNCFASNNWKGWTATPDGDTLYLRVGLRDIYRVDLTPGSYARKYPGYFLVNKMSGSDWICSPLDLNLAISSDYGFHQPLIARSLRKLTPEEAAAIPRKYLP